ncbi:NADPH-dependent FMN reductase [Breoghania sp. L-A4]|uniref:NADPH-dependent FMN reductase n=1 Tax=Breoghania sp. L-A4 TaxID=2304600 RepID=UPI000E35FFB6|nr:NADPH-dependent FMN reductase [Breoghania sp. L-A4]AXS42003.1 NAD(P)H-dependent oxidoreductase [Breoghania sp. L-A4]
MTTLLFIPGSLRAASSSRATVRALADRLTPEVACDVADPGALPHYNADIENDPAVARLNAQIAAADGVVFVTPEYNFGIPGVLKNAIDWASRPAFAAPLTHKPCMVISVSGGALGGVRAQAQLKYVLNGMLAKLFVGPEIVIPQANAKVSDGLLTDETILAFCEENIGNFIASF